MLLQNKCGGKEMKIAIYGISRSGKNYFIDKALKYFQERGTKLHYISGSQTLNEMAERNYGKAFQFLSPSEKQLLREDFAKKLNVQEKIHENIVVDGHYAFYDEKKKLYRVFTEFDRDAYDCFFYMYALPSDILMRMRSSEGEKRNEAISEEQIDRWQNYEISEMSEVLLASNKELHIIESEKEAFKYFYEATVLGKYNSYKIAEEIVDSLNLTDKIETIILTDCDKTLSVEDTTDIACDFQGVDKRIFKKIYKNDMYSNYQAWKANRYITENKVWSKSIFEDIANRIHFSEGLLSDLKSIQSCKIYAITAGSCELWQKLIDKIGLETEVLSANGNPISKYVKYFVINFIKEKNKFVIAIGDSLLDSNMLQEAHVGYIITQKGYRKNIEQFLRKNKSIRQLKYFDYQYEFLKSDEKILAVKTLEGSKKICADISICKSSSGVEGKELRKAHYNLGVSVSKLIEEDFSNEEFVVVIMMRSGLLFGLGIADCLDCPVIFHGSGEKDFNTYLNDNLKSKTLILCEGVVNTGKSIYSFIEENKLKNVIIATNVVSDKVERNKIVPIYASRISERSFVGARQRHVGRDRGPDTSDRLFKLL